MFLSSLDLFQVHSVIGSQTKTKCEILCNLLLNQCKFSRLSWPGLESSCIFLELFLLPLGLKSMPVKPFNKDFKSKWILSFLKNSLHKNRKRSDSFVGKHSQRKQHWELSLVFQTGSLHYKENPDMNERKKKTQRSPAVVLIDPGPSSSKWE